MFSSLLNVAKDVTRTVAAPVEIALDAARVVTKPIADAASETASAVKETTREITED